jgi:hypothetical protein
MGVKYFVAPPSDLNGTLQPLPTVTGTDLVGASGAECTLPERPVRGIAFALRGPATAAAGGPGVTFDVAVRAGAQTLESGRYVGSAGAGTLVVALAGEDLPSGGTMRVTISPVHTARPVAMATSDGGLACSAVTPVVDGLKLVHADPGSIIYQRLDAMDRIRWASGSVVIRSGTARVAALARGLPGTDVVLDAPGPAAGGRPAKVTVRQDSGDVIAVDVAAQGAGYRVVADAMQLQGWSASIDGHPVRIVPADEAMVAVPVSAGTHEIVFRYRAPGQVLGAGLSATSLIVTVGAAVWDWRRHRSRRRAGRPPGALH